MLLFPEHRQWRPNSLDGLATGLADLGLLDGNPIPGEPQTFHAGGRFLQLITFLGCSPQVALHSVDAMPGQEVCCIRFRDYPDAVHLASDPLPNVRCQNCRATLKLVKLGTSDFPVRCGNCASLLQWDMIDWRRAAGCGSFFVEVKGIFPHEAVPSERLLIELATYSACQWAYFYFDNRSCDS